MAIKAIKIRTQFIALHRWPNAPESVSYLGNIHRHNFHVEVTLKVLSGDRELEFHQTQQTIDTAIINMLVSQGTPWLENSPLAQDTGNLMIMECSCEDMAECIFGALSPDIQGRVLSVVVSEDGEFDGIYVP